MFTSVITQIWPGRQIFVPHVTPGFGQVEIASCQLAPPVGSLEQVACVSVVLPAAQLPYAQDKPSWHVQSEPDGGASGGQPRNGQLEMSTCHLPPEHVA
jgi:hypothetical protein